MITWCPDCVEDTDTVKADVEVGEPCRGERCEECGADKCCP